jgi:two-component system OmpR family sensor kinase
MAVVVLAVVALVGWVIARSVTSPLRRLNAAATRFADGDLRTEELPATGPPELRELAATMTAMAARLDALLTSQRSFVADASHQLRTPLTALRLRLENVESGLDEPAADEVAAAIEETRRLADLVNQLLLLARVDERPVLEPTDVGSPRPRPGRHVGRGGAGVRRGPAPRCTRPRWVRRSPSEGRWNRCSTT